MKLLRTIALDPSDTFVFEVAAEPGEWAVSGAFRFGDCDPARLQGKQRWAFRGGLLGVQSWGWSTLGQIVEATEKDRSDLVDLLARQLLDRLGAPDVAAAKTAAEEEVAFVESLCTHPVDTLIAVYRTVSDGEIREAFRIFQRREGAGHGKPFSFVEIADEGERDAPVSLVAMSREQQHR